MPVYDYKCPEHGLFHDLGTLENSSDPCACPQCGVQSARVIMIPPEVMAMAPENRKAIAKNEEARHNPIVSSVESREEATQQMQFAQKKGHHKSGCGCSEHKPKDSLLKKQVVYLPDGSKVFPSQRPWMISH